MFKKAISLICIISALAFLFAPVSAYAKSPYADRTRFAADFEENPAYNADYSADEEEQNLADLSSIEVGMDSVKVYFNKFCMAPKVEIRNDLFILWFPIKFENNGYSLTVSGLKEATPYSIRVILGNSILGEYWFYTKPANLDKVNLKVDEDKFINLKWKNEKQYTTEIFRNADGMGWEYLTAVKDNKYKDYDVKPGSKYSYKIRFICNSSAIPSYSDFVKASTFVEEDIDEIVSSRGYIIIRQNDEKNRTIPYPYKDNGKTIGTSGCGVCASLMVLRNTTSAKPTLEKYTKELLDYGCRGSYGSDMLKIAEYISKTYGVKYRITKDVDELKRHLDKGYMATAHVGTKRLFTSIGGHFITIAGYIKSDNGDKAIILDPSFTASKYSTEERVVAGIEYTSDGIVTAPFETLLDDCKSEYFVLFTP